MFFFEVHTIQDGADAAVAYEIVEADAGLAEAAFAAFTGQSFPVFFGSAKVASTLTRGHLHQVLGRTFGKTWTELPPARVQELFASTFGGAAEDYASLSTLDPAPDNEYLFVRRMQPMSSTVELLGRTFADNPLKHDTKVTGQRANGERGNLIRPAGETLLLVTDADNVFLRLVSGTHEIAAWFSDIEDGRYDGSLTFDLSFGSMLPGEVTRLVGTADETEDADAVRERARTVDIASATQTDALGFVLRGTDEFRLPVRGEHALDVAAVTAVASAARDGVLLPDMEWIPTKIVTEVSMLHLASLT